MVKSSAKDVFKWTLGGALSGGGAGFAVMSVGLPDDGAPDVRMFLSLVLAMVAGVIGAGIGAVLEAVVHARRR